MLATTPRPFAHTIGSKYEKTKDLRGRELVALIRSAIKAATPKGFKVSVRKRAGGWNTSIEVSITAMPSEFEIYDRERVRFDETNGREGRFGNWMSKQAEELVSALRAIANGYNYDNSDIQTDYFDCRFYLSVGFSCELSVADRAAAVAEVTKPRTNAQEDFLSWAVAS